MVGFFNKAKATETTNSRNEDEDRAIIKNAEEELLKTLPIESDRRALMGCIAIILSATASHCYTSSDEEETLNDATSARSSDYNRKKNKKKTSSIDKNKRRLHSFQKEFLFMVADLLLLKSEHARCLEPHLDNINILKNASNNRDQRGQQGGCDEKELWNQFLQPYLDSLSNEESAFSCIGMLLFRFLLISSNDSNTRTATTDAGSTTVTTKPKTIIGYDARVRYILKHLTVSVLTHFSDKSNSKKNEEIELDTNSKEFQLQQKFVKEAYVARKFEALEDDIADRITYISEYIQEKKNEEAAGNTDNKLSEQKKEKSMKEKITRGLKVGTAGVAAGTLLAITGGMAAPAIAAGIASITSLGIIGTVAASLVAFPAATTIFGVGGGALVASKMTKRTQGLRDFEIVKETPEKIKTNNADNNNTNDSSSSTSTPELSRTVCIAGWLKDENDFQRPFGVTPTNLVDKQELLGRFCSVHSPDSIINCASILQHWDDKDELWDILKTSYGRDPDTLLPLTGPRQSVKLTDVENNSIDTLIRALGFPVQETAKTMVAETTTGSNEASGETPKFDVMKDVLSKKSNKDNNNNKVTLSDTDIRTYKAWDFHAEYGGELYTIWWEKDLLVQLDKTTKDFTAQMATSATKEVLKQTALHSLMAAVALPATLLSFTNMIDERWTLVTERAEEAGIVLAQTLLNKNAGYRPVSLIGFSFGARVIYSCLKELARLQDIWEEEQDQLNMDSNNGTNTASLSTKDDSCPTPSSSSSNAKDDNETDASVISREPASVIEDVILMGCPASISWNKCRRVVAGRLINCYSPKDLMLAFMYRYKNIQSVIYPPAGICKAKTAGVENYDVSKFISSHRDYCVAVREILEMVGYGQPRRADTSVAEQTDSQRQLEEMLDAENEEQINFDESHESD